MTKAETVELLPCPFCGSRSVAHGLWADKRMAVSCMRCYSFGPSGDEVPEVCIDVHRFIFKAITAWNTRAAPTLTPAQAAADELLAALKLLSKDATTTRAVWVKVKAAIAKAEGREP